MRRILCTSGVTSAHPIFSYVGRIQNLKNLTRLRDYSDQERLLDLHFTGCFVETQAAGRKLRGPCFRFLSRNRKRQIQLFPFPETSLVSVSKKKLPPPLVGAGGGLVPTPATAHSRDPSGRGTARAEDAQGTPTQSHITPSIRRLAAHAAERGVGAGVASLIRNTPPPQGHHMALAIVLL